MASQQVSMCRVYPVTRRLAAAVPLEIRLQASVHAQTREKKRPLPNDGPGAQRPRGQATGTQGEPCRLARGTASGVAPRRGHYSPRSAVRLTVAQRPVKGCMECGVVCSGRRSCVHFHAA